MTILVACAVSAERDAIAAALPAGAPVAICVVGVGPAAAAAATSAELARGDYRAVLSAGIAGGFGAAVPGSVAVASVAVFADLAVETGDDVVPVAEAGFGVGHYPVDPQRAIALADATGGHLGTVLTVATVTGTAATTAALLRRWPDAVAEAMEGAGVAAAAAVHDVAFAEVRAVSNVVGPRDRATWDIEAALAALGPAVAACALVLR